MRVRAYPHVRFRFAYHPPNSSWRSIATRRSAGFRNARCGRGARRSPTRPIGVGAGCTARSSCGIIASACRGSSRSSISAGPEAITTGTFAVSKTIFSGRFRAERIRMMLLSTSIADERSAGTGRYRSAAKSSAKSTLPTNKKYLTIGMKPRGSSPAIKLSVTTGIFGNRSSRMQDFTTKSIEWPGINGTIALSRRDFRCPPKAAAATRA